MYEWFVFGVLEQTFVETVVVGAVVDAGQHARVCHGQCQARHFRFVRFVSPVLYVHDSAWETLLGKKERVH